jgi:hypothetical protein
LSHPDLNIPDGARVLEIGSGHNPHPRADVLCDRYLEDRERAGTLKRDRPLVIADGGALPFADKAFDYVLAIHVAEHADDIGTFFRELSRVARAGYLETPSAIGERLFGWEKHRWTLFQHDASLYVRPHSGERQFGRLFHHLMRADPQMTAIYYRYPDLFRVRHHWQGEVSYRMLAPGDPDPIDLDDAEILSDLLSRRSPARKWLRAYLPRGARDRLWQRFRDWSARRHRGQGGGGE